MTPISRGLVATLSVALGVGLLTSGLAGQPPGGKTKANVAKGEAARSAKVTANAKAVHHLELAYALIHYGRAHKAPEALITAARILSTTPTKEVANKPKREKNPKAKAAKGEKAPGKAHDDSPKALLAEAKKMSGDNEHIVALADEVAKSIEVPRGSVEGPYKKIDTLPFGMKDTFKRTFRAGEQAVVVVAADLGADLDVQVIDNNGNFIANIPGPRLDFVAQWVPLRTDVFYIVVLNRGKNDARYGIAHN